MNRESMLRANELSRIAQQNKQKTDRIACGADPAFMVEAQQRKNRILAFLNASLSDWDDYAWQVAHRIHDVQTLNAIFPLEEQRKQEIALVSEKYRWSISPYYLSLIDTDHVLDEIGLMAIPNILETQLLGEIDPMAEAFTNPAPRITRRYPDRLIINVTNMCGMYCRFCQRKRNIGENDTHAPMEQIQEAVDYIAACPEIREVLITGGDPLTLSDDRLEAVIRKVRAIPHVEVIRIGTRVPVTLPQRITQQTANMLKKYHPLYVNVHFNHPKEVTPEAERACALLADAGIALGNQMVLLNGVNNHKDVVMKLNQQLLRIRVRPYYIFHAKHVRGTCHFNCSVEEGISIIDHLRGNTSGMAIPTFIVNATGGLGKVPLHAEKYKRLDDAHVEITTWEGKKIIYQDEEAIPLEEQYSGMAE